MGNYISLIINNNIGYKLGKSSNVLSVEECFQWANDGDRKYLASGTLHDLMKSFLLIDPGIILFLMFIYALKLIWIDAVTYTHLILGYKHFVSAMDLLKAVIDVF